MALGNGSSSRSFGEGADHYMQETGEQYFSEVDSSDSENEEVPMAFATPVPRGLGKRTYGVFVDDVLAERRLKNAKLDEQLASLRSILPGSVLGEEKASVLMDAYQYIMKLQKSVDELTTELVPLSTTSANPNGLLFQEAQDAQSTSSNSICLLYQHPMVEVKREEGKIEVHIACTNRPGLLVDIMSALESKRITVLHASIACRQNVLFEALSLENCQKGTLVLHSGPEPLPTEAEDHVLKEIIAHAIRNDASGNNSL
ncbi:transcription factor ICE1 isoform X1 [Physcomitrium patens]|uniref:Plant bHLH transcription factor ACT-like domain-containing protein n=1 Tax=Physcomitrium patens TaxID=3218 RepID=A0A7I4B9D9_PHYPA|nr:transcription factor FAMA-like isoform X1 [Physcomitrium patens]XP_024399434.1 transcription factor FAMA-like isoform X1 [Physcomitrium patens]XP_024399435.1 transcription factor FAMA-like isoform X1 [Physcomitrium patens]XP_024399438.1 transcription factor FAMA-like isoform X1 [Physcomitrium patens]|eukprot:XP_024399433.1 transcription factor FAMA-like isoform X1 [Physcomitrella patens]